MVYNNNVSIKNITSLNNTANIKDGGSFLIDSSNDIEIIDS